MTRESGLRSLLLLLLPLLTGAPSAVCWLLLLELLALLLSDAELPTAFWLFTYLALSAASLSTALRVVLAGVPVSICRRRYSGPLVSSLMGSTGL
ncbi:hypothetical protein GDO78_002072 [Eleutherodactylus coqui]|uniref:Uncharacterized protein n=1 Tax=Eleutherodactylus coqui TaxID=57060 RepID=A0A8J6KHZ2_ELECQ|nr:hypothetical protein GDO78_002072 [Eleutherodactylus coqui]